MAPSFLLPIPTQRLTHLISKSRISSVVNLLVTSNSCRILSSRCCFRRLFSLPCSTLTKSPSCFSRSVSTELSRLSDAFVVRIEGG